MRYINRLTEEEKKTLEEFMHNNKDARGRIRAHAIMLSGRRYRINEIAKLYETDRDTVARWLDRWEAYGIVGLYDYTRAGRPSKLTEEEKEKLKELVKEEPRSIKQIAGQIEKRWKKKVSVSTLKRQLKQAGYVWKRMRASLRGKRNEKAYDKGKMLVDICRQLEEQGALDLYYFDESGFSLTPSIPYGWQEKNKQIELPASKSERINVLGFLSRGQHFQSYIVEGRVDTEVVVECFDAFAKTLTKRTFVLLDNASMHKSQLFKSKIKEWEEQELYLFYLPAYSPELNIIEILWRFIKYRWLPLTAYVNFDALRDNLSQILAGVGRKYLITFS